MKKPSEFHQDLQEPRISDIATLISQAYFDALDYHLPEKGDNRWSLGCRRYNWVRENIRKAVESDRYPYLSILEDEGQKFTFRIGSVPVRFKRTDAENPDSAVFRQYAVEASQLSLLFFDGLDDPCQLSWRLLVEDDLEGEVVRVAFVGAEKSGRVECFWDVPKEKLLTKLTSIPAGKENGIELKPAIVRLRTEAKDEKKA